MSDSEIETLNDSFESCDSNIHEEYSNIDEGDSILHDGDNVKEFCDQPPFEEGDELEAWNTALLQKQTREPIAETTVQYNDEGEDFF